MSGLIRAFLLLYTASLAMSSPVDPPPNVGGIPGKKDFEHDYFWIVLGDSFSAGPGAGSPFDEVPDGGCLRNDGAYPPQLNKDFPFENSVMQFISCTGAVVDDMIATQLSEMDPYNMIVTLSIGGNNLGFSKVLKACVFKPGGPLSDDCDDTIKEARRFLENDMERVLFKAYDAIWDKLKEEGEPWFLRKVFVQLYPNFFEEDTKWCNTQTMGIIPGYKPLLDNELRRKLNKLGDEVRNRMGYIIKRYKESFGSYSRTFMIAMDQFDLEIYPTHRFCQEGLQTLDDPKIWFFTMYGEDSKSKTVTVQQLISQYDHKTCAKDPKYNKDVVFGWYCDNVRYLATIKAEDQAKFTVFAPEAITKAFHPKTAAFTKIKDDHKKMIRNHAPKHPQYPVSMDQGTLECKGPRQNITEEFYASSADLTKAIDEFCTLTAKKGIQAAIVDQTVNNFHVSVARDDKPGCPPVDLRYGGFLDLCKARFRTILNNCDTDIKKDQRHLWKQGGVFHRDCIRFYIGKEPDKREQHS